jgi:hypothetical protein
MEITIKNERLCKFYRDHPTIDVEHINLFFIDCIEKTVLPYHNKNFLTDIISNFEKRIADKENISSNHSVNDFEYKLNRAFSTNRILKQGDDYIIHRQSMITIHNNIEQSNISEDIIRDFIRSTDHNHSNGIFIANCSGIIDKPNFHIDIIMGRIFVFLNNNEYSMEKIKIAVNIIDRLYEKMREFNTIDKEWVIPKPILDEINREYQAFIAQKDSISNTIKETQKKILAQLDDLDFPALEKFLSTKFSTSVKQGFKCDLCRVFTVNTLKGLAAHKRGCSRKNILIPRTEEINTFSVKNIVEPVKEKNRPFSINI